MGRCAATAVLPSSRPRRKVGVVDIEAVLALVRYRKMYAVSCYAFGGGDTPSLDAIPPWCPVLAACCKTLPELCTDLPELLQRCILDFLDPRLDRIVCPKRYTLSTTRFHFDFDVPAYLRGEYPHVDMSINQSSIWTQYPSCTDQSCLDRLQEVVSPPTP